MLRALPGCRKAIISNKIESLSLQVLEAMKPASGISTTSRAEIASRKRNLLLFPSSMPLLFRRCYREQALLDRRQHLRYQGRARRQGVRTVAALYGYGGPGFSKDADYEITDIGGLLEIVGCGNGKADHEH